jgi:site-specific recombinase XerD
MDNLPATQKLALTKFERTDLPSYLTLIEEQAMLQVCESNRRDHLLIRLLWETGARVSEVLQLTRDSIDSYNLSLKILTEKKRSKKGKPSYRIIPITSSLATEILNYIVTNNIQNKLFSISRQRTFQIVRAIGKRAGISRKIHPHMFRHGYAINLLSQGVPLPIIQRLLGHASILTSMVYLKVTQQDAREFLSRVRF